MASSSSSDFSSGEITTPPRKRKGTPLIMLVPLIYAPVLPLIRIGFRRNPVLRDRLFYGVLAGAFAHGTYLILMAIVQSSFFMLPNVSHTKMWYCESTTSAGLKLRLQQWLLSHFIDKDDEEFV